MPLLVFRLLLGVGRSWVWEFLHRPALRSLSLSMKKRAADRTLCATPSACRNRKYNNVNSPKPCGWIKTTCQLVVLHQVSSIRQLVGYDGFCPSGSVWSRRKLALGGSSPYMEPSQPMEPAPMPVLGLSRSRSGLARSRKRGNARPTKPPELRYSIRSVYYLAHFVYFVVPKPEYDWYPQGRFIMMSSFHQGELDVKCADTSRKRNLLPQTLDE